MLVRQFSSFLSLSLFLFLVVPLFLFILFFFLFAVGAGAETVLEKIMRQQDVHLLPPLIHPPSPKARQRPLQGTQLLQRRVGRTRRPARASPPILGRRGLGKHGTRGPAAEEAVAGRRGDLGGFAACGCSIPRYPQLSQFHRGQGVQRSEQSAPYEENRGDFDLFFLISCVRVLGSMMCSPFFLLLLLLLLLFVEVQDPAVYGNTEWISILFHGQSFMLHQVSPTRSNSWILSLTTTHFLSLLDRTSVFYASHIRVPHVS